jgi:hypothetical protein
MTSIKKLRWQSYFLAVFLMAGLVFLPFNLWADTAGKPAATTSDEDVLAGFEDEKSADDDALSGFDDAPTDDDALSGFEDTPADDKTKASQTKKSPSIWHFSGHLKLAGAYSFSHSAPAANQSDWRGLSRQRTELQLALRIKPSERWQVYGAVNGFKDWVYTTRKEDFNPNVVSAYEEEIEIRELYFQGRLSDRFDVKLGRQIMVWGKSDNVRVTDVLNPLDLREPGLTDIADLRLPVAMSRLDFYVGAFSVTGIAIHEIRFHKIPIFGSDFYPGDVPPPTQEKPAGNFEDTQFGLALNGVFSGWDASFYLADVYDHNTYVKRIGTSLPPVLKRQHARLKMVGAAANLAYGNWLVKTEAACLSGFRSFNRSGQEYARLDALLGFEYAGFKNTTLSIEAVNRIIIDYDAALIQAPDFIEAGEFQSVLRLSRDFLNETLNLTLLLSSWGITGQDGSFERLGAEYDLNDAIKLIGGVVLYQSGNLARFQNIGDNDRVYFEVKYSF